MWDGERLLSEIKTFLRSGLFYIMLGCVFLWTGYGLSSGTQTHSAFVFIVVILGVALVLYGTGTNATGEGTAGTIKVAIAGGAGVLALLLGFGVVEKRKDLVEVFKRQRDYGVIDLTISPQSGVPLDLGSFDVQARLGGRVPLPLWNDNQRIEIFVPIPDDLEEKTEVTVKFTPRPGSQAAQLHELEDVPVNWTSKEIKETTGFANEKIKVFRKVIEPKKPTELKIQTVPEDENLPAQAITITPE